MIPEYALLLESLRGGGAVPPGVDWADAARRAAWHGLQPLAFRALGDRIPPEAWDLWTREAAHWGRQGLLQAARLSALAAAFREAGVRAVPLKGPFLSWKLHGDPGLRQSLDLDLLVRPGGLAAAERVLGGLGYAPAGPGAWTRPGDPVPVDLHTQAFPGHFPIRFDASGFWSRLREVPFGGGTVWAPDDRDLLALLALHGIKHHWRRLLWLHDLGCLAASMGSLGPAAPEVAGALRLAGGVFGFPVPEGLPPEGPRERRLREGLAGRILCDREPTPLEGFLLHAAQLPRRRDRLAFGVRALLRPTARDRIGGLRAFRIAARHGPELLRGLGAKLPVEGRAGQELGVRALVRHAALA